MGYSAEELQEMLDDLVKEFTPDHHQVGPVSQHVLTEMDAKNMPIEMLAANLMNLSVMLRHRLVALQQAIPIVIERNTTKIMQDLEARSP